MIKGSKRDSYNWRLYSAQAEKFLKAIMPYLVTKKRQAEILIEFRQYVKKRHTGRGFTEFQLKERKRLAIEMRELNIRGGHGRPVPKSWEEVI